MQINDEYFNNDDFREKLKLYEESVKSGHPIFLDAEDLTDIIDYYNLMQMDKEAEQTADYALTLFPGASGPITYKVRRCIDENDFEKAEELIEEVFDKDIDYKYIKAEIFLAKNMPDEANRILEEAVALADEDDLDNSLLDATNIMVDYGYFEMANDWINKVEDKSSEDYVELKVKILSNQGEIDKAERLLNKLIDKNPYEHKYWNLLSYSQLSNDRISDALTSNEFSLAVSPDNPEGILCKARILSAQFSFEEAVKYYVKYSHIYPNDINCLLQIGYCFMNMSKNEEALNIYLLAEKKAEDDKPMLRMIYENIALAYSHLYKMNESMAYIDKLEIILPQDEKYNATLIKGYVLLENKQLKDGILTLSNLLNECHNAPIVLLKVSVVLYENRLIEAAYVLMHDYYPLGDESNIYGYAYYALYCYDLGKDEEFLKMLEIAVERNPEESITALHHIFPEGMKPTEYIDYILKNNKDLLF